MRKDVWNKISDDISTAGKAMILSPVLNELLRWDLNWSLTYSSAGGIILIICSYIIKQKKGGV